MDGIGLGSVPQWLREFMERGGIAGAMGMEPFAKRLTDLGEMQRARMAGGDTAPVRPGTPEYDAAVDVASSFDFTGAVGKAGQSAKSVIKDWRWLPEKTVAERVGAKAVPEHVEQFGDFMAGMAAKAKRQELTPRDLVKAFTITRASIQRQAMDASKLRERWPDFPGPADGKVRPEGAFSEWLLTPMGKRYLDKAEAGELDLDAIKDVTEKLGGFGKTNDYVDAMTAAASLKGQEGPVGEMIAQAYDKPGKGVDAWREWAMGLRGIGPAKSGFIASLLGRGDQPTLDARQILLQTGGTTAEATPYLARKGGLGGRQAVDRLARRQENMALEMRPDLEPFRQHLTHHTIWDAYGGDRTTHDDVVRAMRLAGVGGLGLGTGLPLMGQDDGS
jgi:hypothetical protein